MRLAWDGNGSTPERLKSLLTELDEATAEAAHLCDSIENSPAYIHAQYAAAELDLGTGSNEELSACGSAQG